MFTPTTPLLPKNKKIATWFICCSLALLSAFPIYSNFYYSNGLQTYERHRAVIEQRSEFYNPWQYRILCPYLIESALWLYNHSVDKIYPIEERMNFAIQSTSGTSNETDQFVQLMQRPGAMKYMVIFVLFRFVEHLFIYYLAWKLWRFFIKSEWLIFLGINFLALALGNAVTAADLSFNTYMDIIFYLLTANIIVYNKNKNWIVPIALLAAFNRETGILIPALFFISQTDFTVFNFKKVGLKNIRWPQTNIWMLTTMSYLIFISIFIGLRIHYGYQPQQVWKVPAGLPMLKLNVASAVGVKAYMELIGSFAVIPLVIIYQFKHFPTLLKKWFLFLTPIWFLVHYVSVVAYQTRLFMVPFILIMLPMMLWLVEKEIKTANTSDT